MDFFDPKDGGTQSPANYR